MPPTIELSIPSASTVSPANGKAYTVYNISLRLPLRTYTVAKRFSDFTALHSALTTQASGTPPPASLPAKHWLTSTTNNPGLTEERRAGLESYLRAILSHPDGRWRDTPAWRAFLNLPPASHAASAASLHSAYTTAASSADGLGSGAGAGSGASDPTVWLDTHRELVGQLQAAREQLAARNKAHGAREQQEAGARAKKALVRAGQLVTVLEKGLRGADGDEWGAQKMGEGEVRRRKDLLAAARRERERLEELQANIGRKEGVEEDVRGLQGGSNADVDGGGAKARLFGQGPTHNDNARSPLVKKGRVLGQETAKTRELDNNGVLQLQQQLMQDQDEDINLLTAAMRRQKQLAIEINGELEVQNEMLTMLDDDVDRVQGRMDVARKRVARIS